MAADPIRQSLITRARAKVNLSLHVLGRRQDGYHLLHSLVAFAGIGDELRLMPGEPLSLSVGGPLAMQAGPDEDNLVLKATHCLSRQMPDLQSGAFRLIKRLPAAAGLGGGSADAAAALRLLARLNRLPPDHPAVLNAAQATGADVPVCLTSRTRWMGGIGDILSPAVSMPRFHALLVNPGVACPTGPVFAGLGLQPGTAPASTPPAISDCLSRASVVQTLVNDLEAPAIALVPIIGDVLEKLRTSPDCLGACMSGSGASCFGLFQNCRAAATAGKALRRAHPQWWIAPTVLG